MTFSPVVRFIISTLFFCTAINVCAKSIVLINSYHIDYPWSKQCLLGFEENIDPGHQINYFEMDTKRLSKTDFAQHAEQLWAEIKAISPDLVVTMDDNALKYLGQKISTAGIPLVFMGVNNNPREYFNYHQMPGNIAGVLERPPLKQNVTLLSKMLSIESGNILLMMDNSMTANAILEFTLKGQKTLEIGDVTLHVFMTDSYTEWQAQIKRLSTSHYNAVIITSYANLKDQNGEQVTVNTSSRWISEHSVIPVFAMWHFSVGKGKAIGGLLQSARDQGVKAAEIVNTILKTGKVPYYEVSRYGEYIFSRHELSRWNLTLPEGIKQRAQFIE